MVNIGYFLFSSYGIPSSVREVLWIIGSGVGRYLDIARLDFEDISEWVLVFSKTVNWMSLCVKFLLMNY